MLAVLNTILIMIIVWYLSLSFSGIGFAIPDIMKNVITITSNSLHIAGKNPRANTPLGKLFMMKSMVVLSYTNFLSGRKFFICCRYSIPSSSSIFSIAFLYVSWVYFYIFLSLSTVL